MFALLFQNRRAMIFGSGKLLINRGDWIRTNDLLLPRQILAAHIIGPPSFETTLDHINPCHSAEIAYNIACRHLAQIKSEVTVVDRKRRPCARSWASV